MRDLGLGWLYQPPTCSLQWELGKPARRCVNDMKLLAPPSGSSLLLDPWPCPSTDKMVMQGRDLLTHCHSLWGQRRHLGGSREGLSVLDSGSIHQRRGSAVTNKLICQPKAGSSGLMAPRLMRRQTCKRECQVERSHGMRRIILPYINLALWPFLPF